MIRKELLPSDALKRSGTSPSIVVIGPSTSGKSTIVYLVVNHRIVGFISVGIGEKSQTTLIPCDFVFDERIAKDEYFALKIVRKVFDKKSIYIIIQEELCELYCANAQDVEDTLDSIDDQWIDSILEPKDASYHLGVMKQVIDSEELKNILAKILQNIDSGEVSFGERVKEKKKELGGQKIGIKEIRKLVFEELWDKISDEIKGEFDQWLNAVGICVNEKLNDLLDVTDNTTCIFDFSVEENTEMTYGAEVLSELFNPIMPYSLVISEMTLACKPRAELIGMSNKDIPLRFCFRDTVGLTQTGTDEVSIRTALDAAMNCNPDSILLLFSLDERNDTLAESCEAIAERLSKADKMDIPVNVLFTKADRIIGNKVNIKSKGKLVLTQQDYNEQVRMAIDELNYDIDRYLVKIPRKSVEWLSLRYLDESMDPIQKALIGDELGLHFKPDGLYNLVGRIVGETQRRILPQGIKNPVFVTAEDPNKPAVEIRLDYNKLSDLVNNIQTTLTEDKSTVNGYQITTKYTLSGRSVNAYWRKLSQGLGHKTNATVYGNFSINMKGMLNKILTQNIVNLVYLYQEQAIHTVVDNLSEEELNKLVVAMNSDGGFSEDAFDGINPELVAKMSISEKNMQVLHNIFRKYFETTGKYYMVMDRVAFQLTYGNSKIQKLLINTYNQPIGYDETMRKLQKLFKAIYANNEFGHIILEEIGKVMTELINKMFITI